MKTFSLLVLFLLASTAAYNQENLQRDTFPTDKGDLIITFLGHGTLYFTFDNLVIHIDPVSRAADYSKLPKADLIFVTHQHGDHMQAETIEALRKEGTQVVMTQKCAENYSGAYTLAKNGDVLTLKGIKVETVPAYNVVNKRDDGNPYHPKGEGNGYVFNFGDTRVYVAGDTENYPEMKDLKAIDIAFLPMNLPYTMTPEMVVEAVKVFRPGVLYPYHYGNTPLDNLSQLMKNIDYCELRLRKM